MQLAAVLYEPLHHKYRPQTFAQLVGQSAIADTLTHALEQNRIAPAYLFCGPRGTGKTSSARILAKSLNCLNSEGPTPKPCGKCDLCLSVSRGNALDIVEIDAASNTGVDNIRELIERAQFAPVQCRYKAYVIDECHMLSTAAFNALLKTLEEPPDRVVFVLATTDPQRVLPTIISRCQRFDFRRIPLPAMIKHLSYIAKKENIAIAESALQLVAQIAQGGLRDAESLLDQLSLQSDEITVEIVWDLVGAVPERDLLNLVRAIAADDGTVLIDRVRNLMDKGREPLIVLQSLVGFYRDLLIAKTAPAREDLVAITPATWVEMTEFAKKVPATQILASQQKLQTAEVQVKNTTQPRLWLEITLTGLLPSALGAIAALDRGSAPVSVSVVSAPSMPAAMPAATVSSAASAAPSSVTPQPTASSAVESTPALTASTAPSVEPPSQNVKAEASADPRASQADSLQVNSSKTILKPVDPPASTNALPSESITSEAESRSPDPDPAFGSLFDLWKKILATLEPRGTQMLMGQQGILLAFDGVSAKVGFKSASLQKMARDRVPNLEKALATIFNRPIHVSLEVVSSGTAANQPADNQTENPPLAPPAPSALNNPPPSPHPSQAHSSQAPLPQSSQPNSGQNIDQSSNSQNATPAPDSQIDNQNNGQSNSQSNRQSNGSFNQPPDASKNSLSDQSSNRSMANDPVRQPPNPSVDASQNEPPARPTDNLPSAPSSTAPGQWQTNQEQENIKRFAQFFNGQIVDLDDDIDPAQFDIEQTKKQRKSSEPGPDVPF